MILFLQIVQYYYDIKNRTIKRTLKDKTSKKVLSKELYYELKLYMDIRDSTKFKILVDIDRSLPDIPALSKIVLAIYSDKVFPLLKSYIQNTN